MNRLYGRLARYYDAVYSFKDYRREADRVMALVGRYGRSQGREWLDVACGTGRHLEHFARRYQCTGVDASPAMLRLARRRLRRVRLVRADMQRFELGHEFDVVSCLFSAIGYVRTRAGLERAVQTFARHLKPGGVLVIEPWLTPTVFRPGFVHLTIHDTPDLKIARMSTSERRGPLSRIHMHYLIGEPGRPVRYVRDVHTSGLFSVSETNRLLQESGLRSRYLRQGLMKDRGLFIAVKPMGTAPDAASRPVATQKRGHPRG